MCIVNNDAGRPLLAEIYQSIDRNIKNNFCFASVLVNDVSISLQALSNWLLYAHKFIFLFACSLPFIVVIVIEFICSNCRMLFAGLDSVNSTLFTCQNTGFTVVSYPTFWIWIVCRNKRQPQIGYEYDWEGRMWLVSPSMSLHTSAVAKLVSFVWLVRHSKNDKTLTSVCSCPTYEPVWAMLMYGCRRKSSSMNAIAWNLPAEIELVSPSKFRWPMAAAVSSTASKPVNEINGRTNESPFYS